jgi:hypothetical protein
MRKKGGVGGGEEGDKSEDLGVNSDMGLPSAVFTAGDQALP